MIHTRASAQVDGLLHTVLEAAADPSLVPVDVPGICVGVTFEGERAVGARGILGRTRPLPVTEGTRFQLGSVSKLYTALLVVGLAEDGLLELDAPVCSYVPDLVLADPDTTARVSCRALLQHRSGIDGDYLDDTGRGPDALDSLLPVLRNRPQVLPCDAGFNYANLGFALLGLVAQRVTGEPFETLMCRRVLEPLRLRETTYLPEAVVFEEVALGHHLTEATGWGRPRNRSPNGGVVASARDVLTFLEAHLDGLDSGLVNALCEPVQSAAGAGDAIGLGWMSETAAGARLTGHAGTTPGFQSYAGLIRDRAAGVVILTNAAHGDPCVAAAKRAFVEAVTGVTVPDLVPGAAPDGFDAVAGTYRAVGPSGYHADGGARLVARLVNGILEIDSHPDGTRYCVDVAADGRFAAGQHGFDDIRGRVPLRDGRATGEWLHWFGRLHPRVEST